MIQKITFSMALISSLTFNSCNQPNSANQFLYQGDLTGEAQLKKDKNTKTTSLTVASDGKWILYEADSVVEGGFTRVVAEGDKSGTYPLVSDGNKHLFFQFQNTEGSVILAETLLPLTGAYNVRDLGGIKTENGRYLKWGKIFRADDLNNLTSADQKYLSTIPINTVVDFRSEQERLLAPDKPISGYEKTHQLDVMPGNLMELMKDSITQNINSEQLMINLNQLLITDTASVAQYRKFFDLVQQKKSTPLLYHCSAGKDRTGLATALILAALGVGEDAIYADYLKSNAYLGDKYAAIIAQDPNKKDLLIVKKAYLKAAFDQIKRDHRSIEAFLTKELKVEIYLDN